MALYKFEGKVPQIHPKAYVHESAQVIGDVVIGDHCFVGAGAIIRGDFGSIKIGDRVAVEEGCIIHAPGGGICSIGSDILLGHGALVHCAELGSNSRVGIGAILGIWAVIGDWVVIAEGTVIPNKKTITGGHVYMGNPARAIRTVSEEERQATPIGIQNYADLCDRYRTGLEKLG